MRRAFPFVIGLALMTAFWPGISGLATTPRWDVGAALALALFFGPHGRGTPVHWIGLALIAWLTVTLAWSSAASDGSDEALKLVVAAVAFAWAATLDDIDPLIAGAAVGMAASSLIALAQWFNWQPVPSYGLIGGLFYNGDRLAEAGALVFAAALARRMWWAMPAVLPGMIFAESRVAFLAAIVALAFWIWTEGQRFERFVLIMIAAYVMLGAAMLSPFWLTGGFAERAELYGFTVTHLTWLGHGLGSFVDSGLTLGSGASFTRPEHPHNEWLWLAYEGGLPAVGAGLACAVALWRAAGAVPLRVVLVALLVQSVFFMPFHDPASVIFAAVVAGHLVGADARLRAAADDGGGRVREGVPAASAG